MQTEPARFPRRALVVSLCALVLAAAPLAAAEKAAKADAPKADPAQDAAMAEMMKYAAPGPAHEVLKSMVGTWEAAVKMVGGPGEPTVTPGTSENRLVLGGRYLEQRFTSTLFDQPFEGWGLMGFDNRRGVYTNVWVDNSSTEVLTGDGSWDAATKTMTATMKGAGPHGTVMNMRNVTRVVDADTHVFSMYSDMSGKEQLMMEITYKRKR